MSIISGRELDPEEHLGSASVGEPSLEASSMLKPFPVDDWRTQTVCEPEQILVDAHVHFQEGFDLDSFLQGAHRNFQRASNQITGSPRYRACMCILDTEHERSFERIRAILESNDKRLRDKGFKMQIETDEVTSLYISAPAQGGLVLIAGTQVRTVENLEVLAIGTKEDVPSRLDLADTIDHIRAHGAIAVVPWGFGKWLGRRHAIVEQLIQNASPPNFFVADTGNRPIFWPTPDLLETAAKKGIRNLPGSDPLPFSSNTRRAGSYGFVLQPRTFSMETPTHSLIEAVQDPQCAITPYGQRQGLLDCIRNQTAMQLRKLYGN